jgi:uncharacterized SAM-binding protein YcdF (DUF218 family)
MPAVKRHLILFFRWALGLAGAVLAAHTLGALFYAAPSLATFLPGLVGMPLLAVALAWRPLARWSQRGWGRAVRWVFWLGYAGFLAAFLVVFPLMLRGALEPPAPGADAVVVLGAGVRGTRVSQTLAYRLDAALSYAQANPAALVVVSGGQGPGEDLPEADAMADYLLAAGLSPDRLVLEAQSTSTEENFLFSRALLDARLQSGYRTVYVTNGFHVYRAGLVAHAQGWTDIDGLAAPEVPYLKVNNWLRETLAIYYYWILVI